MIHPEDIEDVKARIAAVADPDTDGEYDSRIPRHPAGRKAPLVSLARPGPLCE